MLAYTLASHVLIHWKQPNLALHGPGMKFSVLCVRKNNFLAIAL